jgi:hypothetical protein
MLIDVRESARLWRTKDHLLRIATLGSSPRASLTPFACLLHIVPFFADLVAIARSLYPIPSRTRPSKSSAPMVLSLKAWKSRSLPDLQRTEQNLFDDETEKKPRGKPRGFFIVSAALSRQAVVDANRKIAPLISAIWWRSSHSSSSK